MLERLGAASPRLTARVAGAAYLLMMVTGGLAAFARRGLFVRGDAVATAANILAHERLFLLSFALEMLLVAWYVAVTALLYVLLKPVNRSISLLAALFSILACTIQAGAGTLYIAPLLVLRDAPYMGAFPSEQRTALAYLCVGLYNQTYRVAIVFFGLYCLTIGYLAFRSGFLPRFVGVLMAIAGLAGLTFLSPTAGAKSVLSFVPFALGEGVLTFWLLIAGVNVARWREKADAARAGGS